MVRRSVTYSWLVLTLSVLVILATLAGCGKQESYPSRPITLLVGLPAGGPTDLIGRALCEALKKHLPQPVVVENKPGAAQAVAMADLAKAKPDGYTLGLAGAGILTLQPHQNDLPFKLDDFVPIAQITVNPITLAVKSDSGWKTLKDFLEYVKSNPGKVRIAVSGGVGNVLYLAAVQLTQKGSLTFTIMPTSGGSETTPLVLGGHVEAAIQHYSEYKGQAEAGQITCLGIFMPERNPMFPGVPTFKELGIDVTEEVFNIVVAPKSTPDHVVKTLADAIKKVAEDKKFKDFAAANSIYVHYLGPEDVAKKISSDYVRYKELVERFGLRQKSQGK